MHVAGGGKPTFGPRSDPKYAIPREDILVTFAFEDIYDLELNGFSHQNVIFSLTLERAGDVVSLVMEPCYGLAGRISARTVRIEFERGGPVDRRLAE